MIDICTTATIRPDILNRTLESFKKNLICDYPARMIVNIDPVGEHRNAQEVVDVCRRYFPAPVIRFADKPSFPKAFLWCWRNVISPYVLQLEDDWELLEPVSLAQMIATLDRQKNLAMLRLSAFRSGVHNAKHWNKFLDWNGRFFEVQEQDRRRIGFCGHPALIKREWIEQVLPLMNTVKNPEKQLQFPEYNSNDLLITVLGWRYGVYQQQQKPAQIKDIGRDWIAGSGWKKKGNRAYFTEWERTE